MRRRAVFAEDYVWLSFYGPIVMAGVLLLGSAFWRSPFPPWLAAVVVASILVSPLVGIYAFIRLSLMPDKTNLMLGLAAIGLLCDFAIATFIYLPL